MGRTPRGIFYRIKKSGRWIDLQNMKINFKDIILAVVLILGAASVVTPPCEGRRARRKVSWKYFHREPQKSLRIVFDLDDTLVSSLGPMAVRPRAGEILKEIKARGHKLILWTTASRQHWDVFRRQFPELDVFDETYTRYDLPLGETIESYARRKAEIEKMDLPDWAKEILYRDREKTTYPEWVKDIRFVRGDLLFDDAAEKTFESSVAKALEALRDKYILIKPISFQEIDGRFDPEWIKRIVEAMEPIGG